MLHGLRNERSDNQHTPHNMSEEACTEAVRPKNGLVGLFDILGYRVFLEKNNPEDAAKEVMTVLRKLLGLPENMPQAIAEPLAPILGPAHYPAFQRIVNPGSSIDSTSAYLLRGT